MGVGRGVAGGTDANQTGIRFGDTQLNWKGAQFKPYSNLDKLKSSQDIS